MFATVGTARGELALSPCALGAPPVSAAGTPTAPPPPPQRPSSQLPHRCSMCRVRAAVWGAEWSPRHQSRGAGGSARGSAGGSRTPRQELDAAFTGRALRPAPSRQHRAGPGPGHGRNHSSACCCHLGGKTGLGQHRDPPRGLQPPPPQRQHCLGTLQRTPQDPLPLTGTHQVLPGRILPQPQEDRLPSTGCVPAPCT